MTDRKGRRRIVAAGASTAPFARIIDSYVDMLLVDCGLVATIHGIDRPMDVSLDLMVAHGQAVMRASRRAAVVVELPAKCCEDTPDRALQDAEYLIESVGCAGIALAIEVETIEIIRLLADSGIPVLGLTEIGTPRRSHVSDSDDPDWRRLQVAHNAQAAASAGSFAVLATGSEDSLAEELARTVGVPVIGDESASVCDGQFLTDLDFMSMLTNVRSSNRARSPAVRLVETRNTAPIETGYAPTGYAPTGSGPSGTTPTGYAPTGSGANGTGANGIGANGIRPTATAPAAAGSIKLPPKPVAPVPEPVAPRPTAEARPTPPAPARRPAAPPPVEPIEPIEPEAIEQIRPLAPENALVRPTPARRPAAPPPVEPIEPEAIEQIRPLAPENAPVRPVPTPVRRLPAALPVHLSAPPPAPQPAPAPAAPPAPSAAARPAAPVRPARPPAPTPAPLPARPRPAAQPPAGHGPGAPSPAPKAPAARPPAPASPRAAPTLQPPASRTASARPRLVEPTPRPAPAEAKAPVPPPPPPPPALARAIPPAAPTAPTPPRMTMRQSRPVIEIDEEAIAAEIMAPDPRPAMDLDAVNAAPVPVPPAPTRATSPTRPPQTTATRRPTAPTGTPSPDADFEEELTQSRISWTGPAKSEKPGLLGAIRGRLKQSPR
ncbi:hypothetical protein ABB55_05920 [Prosthecomicrobium hirschii]|uniref:3-methyl-2-oxobutanoate hydroxymethyltransferase n=1 Tax=Prosthecodimorpha hirschii TaxID=665126 RepID=A0A0P6VYI9_9HYPH|nr:hypothetical protein ABB55_05920 [Prosthecomicrobium hirschii]